MEKFNQQKSQRHSDTEPNCGPTLYYIRATSDRE